MQLIKDIPAKQLMAGITGHYAHGSNMSFGFIEIVKGTKMPAHQHIHEQITYVIEGELDMTIDGTLYPLTAGMYYVIPSNTLHAAFAKTDCKLIDVFAPVRKEYL